MGGKYKSLVILQNYHSNWAVASGISNFQPRATRTLRLIMDHHDQANRVIREWKPDVLLVQGDFLEKIKTRLPIVSIFGERSGRKTRFNATVDNAAIGKDVAEYFIGKGFRNFAFITGEHTMPFSAPRLEEFRNTLDDHGFTPLVFDDLCMSGLNPIQSSDKNMKRLGKWLKKAPKPLAVFAHDDTHGLHILEACEQAGLKVPEDIAVLGVDNHPILCAFSSPQLSSVELPFNAVGRAAARIAEEVLFEKDREPENIAFAPFKIVTRGSSDIIATTHPELRAAIQYISSHLSEPLQPKDVANQIFASRSKLQRCFRAELNRTILEEIHRQKLEKAKELLEQTRLAVYEVGERCGMPGSPQFIRFFTQKVGISPLKYRENHHGKELAEQRFKTFPSG